MSLTLVITAAGRAALLNAENTGTASVNIASIGISATVINATAATAVLPGEIKRIATIAGTLIAADQIHVTITDETVDVYTLRSLAVYLGDGTLFAAYGQPTPILEKSATALMLLALDITLLDAAAVAFTFGDAGFLNPQATTERVGVVELATPSETQAGLDTTRSVTPAGLLAAFATLLGQVWRASNDGAGSGLDADLLDGQQGSWYADIVSRLGYTPPNRAGDTFTGPIRRDGGFAIDFVGLWPAIGWEINDYDAYIRSVDQRLFVIAGTQVVTFGGDGVVNAIGGYRANGSLVWHAGNDGPGSGLDADLLDGLDSSFFTNIIARLGYTPLNAAVYSAADILAKLLTVDGSGSGLDADLLDGRDSSSFAPNFQPAFTGTIVTVNGGLLIIQHDGTDAYIRPTNAASSFWLGAGNANILNINAAGIVRVSGSLVWHAGNDGPGSGLDADLLDGQQGSWYADIVSRLGYTPPNRAGDTFTGPIRRDGEFAIDFVGLWPAIGWEINDYDAYIRSVDQRLFVIAGTQVVTFGGDGVVNAIGGYRANGSLVWHAGNDGPGSGLDADLLDGYNSSNFDRVVASSLIAQGGYITYANDRKKCWGWIDLAANSAGTWFYPISFDSFAHPKCAAQAISGNNDQRDNIGIENLPGLSSITVRNAENVALRMWIEMEGV